MNGRRRYSFPCPKQGHWGLGFHQEFELLKRCNEQQEHEPSRHNLDPTDKFSHVVRVIGAYDATPEHEEHGKFHIVMEALEGGELYGYLLDLHLQHGDGPVVSEETALGYTRQMLQAVEACHYSGFAHLDVKPENFLFERVLADGTPDVMSRLVLVDFGSAEAFATAPYARTAEQYVVGADDQLQLHRIAGTARYVPPEVITGLFSSRSDVWSIGAVLYLMLMGETPFSGLTMTALSARSDAVGNQPSYDQAEWSTIRPEVKQFVQRCLAARAEDRMSATEALLNIDKLTQANRVCLVGAPNHLVGLDL